MGVFDKLFGGSSQPEKKPSQATKFSSALSSRKVVASSQKQEVVVKQSDHSDAAELHAKTITTRVIIETESTEQSIVAEGPRLHSTEPILTTELIVQENNPSTTTGLQVIDNPVTDLVVTERTELAVFVAEEIEPDSIDDEIFMDYSLLFSLNFLDAGLSLLDPKFAKEQLVLPVRKEGNKVVLVYATSQGRQNAEKFLQSQYPNLRLKFQQTTEDYLQPYLEEFYSRKAQQETNSKITQYASQIIKSEMNLSEGSQVILSSTAIEVDNPDSAFGPMTFSLMLKCRSLRATDMTVDFIPDASLDNSKGLMVCKARIDGIMETIFEMQMSLSTYKRISYFLKVKCGLDQNKRHTGITGILRSTVDFGAETTRIQCRIEFAPAGEDRGEAIAIRFQERDKFKFNLEDNLGFLPFQLEIVKEEIMTQASKVTFFSGNIGSGKNTALICLLNALFELYRNPETNDCMKRIITIEDGIEFILIYALQNDVSSNSADENEYQLTFAKVLKNVLRLSPDVIMFGETRDEQSAQAIFQAAILGHFILTTIHASSCFEVFNRLRDLGLSNYQISSATGFILNQRLVRRICTVCTREIDNMLPRIPRLNEYIEQIGWNDEVRFTRASGRRRNGFPCETCRGKGYFERIGIFEILRMSSAIKELVESGASTGEMRKQARKEGFRSLWSCGMERVLQGVTTLSELVYWYGKPDPADEGLVD